MRVGDVLKQGRPGLRGDDDKMMWENLQKFIEGVAVQLLGLTKVHIFMFFFKYILYDIIYVYLLQYVLHGMI